MGSKVCIIYATQSKMIRRLIMSDDDSGLDKHAGPGESFLIADKKDGWTLPDAAQAVLAATGIAPADPYCAVMKGDVVLKVVCADPTLDAHPEGPLVPAYQGVGKDHTYDPITKLFSAPLVTTPAGTLNKEGVPIPKDIVTGGVVSKPTFPVVGKLHA